MNSSPKSEQELKLPLIPSTCVACIIPPSLPLPIYKENSISL